MRARFPTMAGDAGRAQQVNQAGGFACLVLSENHYGTWEWRVMLCVPKFQSTSYESDFTFHTIFMPPFCICPRRQQANNGRSILSAYVCFSYPRTDFPTIWRVHPAHATPFLNQAVVGFREILRTFCIFGRCANIELKSKLLIQLIKKFLRRFPFIC